MKILIVEDEVSNLLALKIYIQACSYEVTICEDATTALEAYRQTFYPIITTDLGLPDMDGLELCRRIRSLPHGEQSMILIVSGRSKPDDFQAALEAEADDYLIKPISEHLLRMRLAMLRRQFERCARCRPKALSNRS